MLSSDAKGTYDFQKGPQDLCWFDPNVFSWLSHTQHSIVWNFEASLACFFGNQFCHLVANSKIYLQFFRLNWLSFQPWHHSLTLPDAIWNGAALDVEFKNDRKIPTCPKSTDSVQHLWHQLKFCTATVHGKTANYDFMFLLYPGRYQNGCSLVSPGRWTCTSHIVYCFSVVCKLLFLDMPSEGQLLPWIATSLAFTAENCCF